MQVVLYGGFHVDTIDLNKWYHVVLVHDHNIDDPLTTNIEETAVKVYVNGEKKLDTTRNITSSNNGYIDFPLQIGDDNCSTDRELTGKVKQVRIYNAPLSEAKIKQNYLAGLKDLFNLGQISEQEYLNRIK